MTHKYSTALVSAPLRPVSILEMLSRLLVVALAVLLLVRATIYLCADADTLFWQQHDAEQASMEAAVVESLEILTERHLSAPDTVDEIQLVKELEALAAAASARLVKVETVLEGRSYQ